eukprot:3221207-Pyramimonas_sp.AAC.1
MRALATARASAAGAGARAIWCATGNPTAPYHAAAIFPFIALAGVAIILPPGWGARRSPLAAHGPM